MSLALLWVFVSLLSGTAELATVAFKAFVSGEFVLVNAHVVWMTPISYLLFLAPVVGSLAVAARVLPKLVSLQVRVFVLVFVSAFGVFFLAYPRLHAVAILLLAAGVATQSSRAMSSSTARYERFARRVVAVLGGFTLTGALFVGGLAIRSGRSGPPTGADARPDAPNVLLLILDTVRASSMSLYGHSRPTTPTLDALAEDGVVFDQAFSTAPWTLTSHASIFTGRYPFELSAGWTTPLDDTHPVLAEVLSDHGYRTGGFVANLLYTSRETGLARGFQHYEDFRISFAEVAVSSSLGRIFVHNPRLRALAGYHDIPGRRTADEIVDRFLSWVGNDADQPFLAFLNFYDAHDPYLPREPFASAFSTGVERANHLIRQPTIRSADRIGKTSMSQAEAREEEGAYEGGIAWIDAEIERMLSELGSRGMLENTVVLVTADHGELFGEHGLYTHGAELYTQVLRVPLLLYGPGVPRRVRVGEAVTLADIPATILALTGVESHELGGLPLTPFWSEESVGDYAGSAVLAEVSPARNQPPGLPSEKGPMQSLVSYPWHYILNGDGREELYDLGTDAEEMTDLAGSAPDSTLARLRVGLRGTHPDAND